MANPFDQFDAPKGSNPFDQFDAPKAPQKEPERTWGEFAADTGIGLAKGAVSVAKLVPMTVGFADTIISKAFGLDGPASGGALDNAPVRALNAAEEYLQSKKSDAIQAKEKASEQKAQAFGQRFADDAVFDVPGFGQVPVGRIAMEMVSKMGTALTDPSLLAQGVSENIASVLPSGAAARGAQTVAEAALPRIARGLTEEAVSKTARTIGVAGGITTGAVQQGADVASETYDKVTQLSDDLWASNPRFVELSQQIGPDKAKKQIAGELATEAGVKAGIESLVVNAAGAKFGGATLESMFLKPATVAEGAAGKGLSASTAKGFVKGGLGEAVTEAPEEGYGAYATNVALQQINPNQDLFQGVGSAAGQGAVTAMAMGSVTGAREGLAEGLISRQRDAIAQQKLAQAKTASEAAAAANEMAGSVDELTQSVDALNGVASAQRPAEAAPAPAPAAAQRPTLQQMQQRADREAALFEQARTAGTEFERLQALEQIQALRNEAPARTAGDFVDLTPMTEMQAQQRLAVLRDQAATTGQSALGLEVVPHPGQADRFAIASRATPSLDITPTPAAPVSQAEAGSRLEAAAQEGQRATRNQMMQPFDAVTDQLQRGIEANEGSIPAPGAVILDNAQVGVPANKTGVGITPYDTVTGTVPTSPIVVPNTVADQNVGEKRQAAQQAINEESMAEQEARSVANQQQAGRALQAQIEQTSQPAAAPATAGVIDALKTPGNQRTAEQVLAVRQAQSRYSAADMSLLERAATAPFTLSLEERGRLRELAAGPAPVAAEQQTRETPNLMGERVARALGLPSNGIVVNSNAKLSTTRQGPGGTLSINDNGEQHTATIVDPSKLGNVGRLLTQIARIFGKRLVVFQSDTLKADGFVLDGNDKDIHINANSSMSPVAVFGHELMHLLKREHPEAYAAVEAVIKGQLTEEQFAAFQKDYGQDATIEELASDLMGNRFQEPQFWTDVFDEIARQNPTGAAGIIARVGAALNRAISAFLKAVNNAQGFKADEIIGDVTAVRAALQTALAQYAKQQRNPAIAMEAGANPAAAPAQPFRYSPELQGNKREMGVPLVGTDERVMASRPRATPETWKATDDDKRLADSYETANGMRPYTSEGQLEVSVEARRAKFSVKREGKYGNHDVLGIPVNKNGTVTLYFPTTNVDARQVVQDRKLRGATATSNRIYLTNESSGPKVMRNPGNIEQKLEGANVLVQIDPSLLQLDREWPDGRKDFFIPIAEGAAFAKKMAQTKLFTLNAPREKGLSPDQTMADITRGVTDGVVAYQGMNAAERRQRLREAKAVLKQEHNVGTLLGENGKLEKTRVGDYGLTYDGKSVASLGLGLASAQKINDTQRLTTCPQSAICESLCLGETSGQNLLYGGLGQFRSGPRLSQYLKTEAMVQHPEDFAIVLFSEIERFTKRADKEDFQVAIRLNVTSDFAPKTFEALIHAFPEVMFYDYTKLASTPIAPNHHLTYSSTGASQVVDGETIVNPQSNWDRMVQRLKNGYNVAMAFTSRNDMPAFVEDQKTGQRFQVWNGDNYDARFLDPKREDGVGMIVGLTNKDRTTKPEEAAKVHNGFFLDYDAARDGDTLVIPDQQQLAGGNRRTIAIQPAKETAPVATERPSAQFSRTRQTETPEFKRWFGDSKVVDANGNPKMVYHGTRSLGEDGLGIEQFKMFKGRIASGAYFADNPEVSDIYSRGDNGNVLPVYLSLQNPATEDDVFRVAADATNSAQVTQALKKAGYDGLIINVGADSNYYVAFNPTQIKSAIGNSGAFDATNPSITASRNRQTETPAFRRWFGDSKVVDENGKPLVVYHGSTADITQFEPQAEKDQTRGFYFSPNKFIVNAYASKGASGGAVYPVYLSIQNPLRLPSDKKGIAGLAQKLSKVFKKPPPELQALIADMNFGMFTSAQNIEALKRLGYDGIFSEKIYGSSMPVWIAFDNTQIKSAIGNSGAFDATNPSITASRQRSPIGFYSALSESVDNLKTNAAPAAGWKDAIKGLVNKGQVKADEVEWTGVNDWLDLQQGKVTKQQVQDYLSANGVQVEETTLGGRASILNYRTDAAEEMRRVMQTNRVYDDEVGQALDTWLTANPDSRAAYRAEDLIDERLRSVNYQRDAGYYVQKALDKTDTASRYSTYTLPGGENYRELLLTLPMTDVSEVAGLSPATAAPVLFNGRSISELTDEERNEVYKAVNQKNQDYVSGHWSKKNILAHIRINDRTDADGNKVLFVEELQSDWAQEGRKKGFIDRKDVEYLVRDASGADKYTTQDKSMAEQSAKNNEGWSFVEVPQNRNGITPAPFVTKTEGWLNLALKRVFAVAAEGGYDKVAFVNGEQSADRYDLSKQVDSITYEPTAKGYYINVMARGSNIKNGDFTAAELEDLVGKEIVQKMEAREGKVEGTPGAPDYKDLKDVRKLSGVDLKIGGEGMKSFYDKIVPQAVSKLLPKLGGGKMDSVALQTKDSVRGNEEFTYSLLSESDGKGDWTYSVIKRGTEDVVYGPDKDEDKVRAWLYANDPVLQTQQLSFDVTDKMREQVAQGLPLFSRQRQAPDTPAFRNWFGDSKVVDENGQPLVVYHGSTEGGLSRTTVQNTFFSDNPAIASGYALDLEAARAGEEPVVNPVYVRIENPLRVDAQGEAWMRIPFEGRTETTDGLAAIAKKRGHDGVIITNVDDSSTDEVTTPATVYITLGKAAQFKSAIGNSGEFSSNNPNITASRQRIVGDSKRDYTPEQRAYFERVGRTVTEPTLKERVQELRKDLGKKLAQGIVDQFRPLRDLSEKAYALARLSKGSAGAFEALLHHGKLSIKDGVYDGDQSGGFIERVGVPLHGELEDFLWWVAANRAERLMAEDRENLFTPEDIAAGKSLDQGTADYDYTLQHDTGGKKAGSVTRDRTLIYRDALKTFDEFNKNAMDMAEQSGLIDSESRPFWENEFYVPFYRVADQEGSFIGGGMKDGLVRQRAFKRLKGGSEKLNSDLLANTLSNWGHLIDAAAKNRAAKESLEAAQAIGIAIEADAETVRSMAKSMNKRGDVVWFMDQGKERYFLIDDPMVMTAITSLSYAGLRGPIMDALSAPKHWLTVGVTASPAFKIKNLVRDSLQAVATAPLSYNVPKNLAEGVKASNRSSQTYVSALASGGLIRFGTMLEGSQAKRTRQLIKMGVKDTTILDSESKVQAMYDKFLEPAVMAYNELGNRGEEINRASLFKQLQDQGMDQATAALMARDLMDFSMQGSWTAVRFLTQVVPFMNARLQGLYKLGRAANEDPKRFGVVLGAVAMASIALMLAYQDDDDWKKREDWDRNNFWWFKIGGVAFRIPKPFEIGTIATLAERGLEYFINPEMTGKRLGKNVKDMMLDSLSMNPVPQLVKPLVDIYSNKDSFSGRPIETMGMDRLQPQYRYTSGTSMVARGLSTATMGALSPVQYDHLIRGYFAWLGSFVVGATDMILRPLTGQPSRPTADYFKVATGNIVSEVSSGGSRYVSQMYDQAERLEQAMGTYRMLMKTGKKEEAREFFKANKEDIIKYGSIEKVKAAETRYNELIRMIERSNLDPDVKKERIRAVQAQKDKVARIVAPGYKRAAAAAE